MATELWKKDRPMAMLTFKRWKLKLENPLGLTTGLQNDLLKDLGQLNDDVVADAVRYVVDGDPADVLLKISANPENARSMRLLSGSASGSQALQSKVARQRRAMFQNSKDAPPLVWVRLAQIYETAGRAGQLQPAPAGWPDWPAVVMRELCTNPWDGTNKFTWPAEAMAAVFVEGGLSEDLLLAVFLDPQTAIAIDPTYYYSGPAGRGMFLSGWGEFLKKHSDKVRGVLVGLDAAGKLDAMQSLKSHSFPIEPIQDLLIEFATGTAKTVREFASDWLSQFKDKVRAQIETTLAEGSAGQRDQAAQLLFRFYGNDAVDVLRVHAENESAKRVVQTIEKLVATTEIDPEVIESAWESLEIAPVEVETGEVPLTDELKQQIRDLFERFHQKFMQHYEREKARYDAPDRPQWMSKPKEPAKPPAKWMNQLLDFVEGKVDSMSAGRNRYVFWGDGFSDEFVRPPDFKLIHLVRLSHAMGYLEAGHHHREFWWSRLQELELYRSRCEEPFDLRTLDAVCATLPRSRPGLVIEHWLAANNHWSSFADWEPDAIWPAFVEKRDLLRKYFGPNPNRAGTNYDWSWNDKKRAAYRVLGMFPQVPPEFLTTLWEVALGESKNDRPLAQTALEPIPDKLPKILTALDDGKQGVRFGAAEWLGRFDDQAAVEPLKKRFKKEKQEIVKGAIMASLEKLGADVNEFLKRKDLLADAVKGLAKKRPKGSEWIPLDTLPTVHWESDGKTVDPQLLQWWVIQGVQQKMPAAGAIVRRCLELCRKDEAEAFALYVLSSWIGHDTQGLSQEEAQQRADKDANQQWGWYQNNQWGKEYLEKQFNNKKENMVRHLLIEYQNTCIGSAIGQKGMLAIVSAAGDRECVRLSEQYIRKWYGQRAAQCKALLEVLSWIEHPSAVQVLLSIANRFRTKSIRKAAEEYVQMLADREGWTLDELADRTIPDGGFEREMDEDGNPIADSEAKLILDYGPRSFIVQLSDDLTPVITRDDGKTVKSPPAPAKNDDEELAKAAKKSFSAAKKTVKEVVKQQSERLYEALCTQRSWRIVDWKRFLADHPVVGRLCTRLVWAAFKPGEAPRKGDDPVDEFLGCFRPLDDGSLTNEEDDEVTIDETSIVRLAHTCNTSLELGKVWAQHLEDYDVEPLFAQFGRESWELRDDLKKAAEIGDFTGHMITTFQLRSKATSLGFVRGEAEDGGSFMCYRKAFPSLGLQAVLNFTGSYLPEEDIPAALTTLHFAKAGGNSDDYSWNETQMPLTRIPAVLLSECYNDVRQIAETGSGFAEDWEKQGYF
jgi:hypothetical protein